MSRTIKPIQKVVKIKTLQSSAWFTFYIQCFYYQLMGGELSLRTRKKVAQVESGPGNLPLALEVGYFLWYLLFKELTGNPKFSKYSLKAPSPQHPILPF